MSQSPLQQERFFTEISITKKSDSQAAIKALGSFSTSKTVTDCKKLLPKVAKRCALMILWVPGHSGIDGNEKTDELARAGSDNKFIGPEPAIRISLTITRSLNMGSS